MAFRGNGIGHRVASMSPTGTNGRGKPGGVKLTLNTNIDPNWTLRGTAAAFQPTTSANKDLLNDSTPDDGPLIVSSQAIHAPTTAKSPAVERNAQKPIGTPGAEVSDRRVCVHFTTDNCPDCPKRAGHYVIIKVNMDLYVNMFEMLSQDFEFSDSAVTGCFVGIDDKNNGACVLRFDDFRTTELAQDQVTMVQPAARFTHAKQSDFAAEHNPDHPDDQSKFYDGQVIFMAEFNGDASDYKTEGLGECVRRLACTFGAVGPSTELEMKDGCARFRVEFCQISAAKAALKSVTTNRRENINGWHVYAVEVPDQTVAVPASEALKSDKYGAGRKPSNTAIVGDEPVTSPTGRTTWHQDGQTGEIVVMPKQNGDAFHEVNDGYASQNNAQRSKSAPFAMTPLINSLPQVHQMQYPALERLHAERADFVHLNGQHFHGQNLNGQYYNGQHLTNGNQHFNGGQNFNGAQEFNGGQNINVSGGQHYNNGQTFPTQGHAYHNSESQFNNSQYVDLAEINSGRDVRTTVMIRNLPNEMTAARLKKILDEFTYGQYDFSYVRMDYQRNASVGYGFVNFSDPSAIIVFCNAVVGRPWMAELNHRKSGSRLAEVSYATVQGFDCCVEKFRNSSVMDECPAYRPKLWWSNFNAEQYELVGTEMEFPAVNNHSKHQRSTANATQVGLFPPQHRRANGGEQQRVGRSQYDRGTTAQQQEDAIWHMGQAMTYPNAFPFPGMPFYPQQMQYMMPQQMMMPQQQMMMAPQLVMPGMYPSAPVQPPQVNNYGNGKQRARQDFGDRAAVQAAYAAQPRKQQFSKEFEGDVNFAAMQAPEKPEPSPKDSGKSDT